MEIKLISTSPRFRLLYIDIFFGHSYLLSIEWVQARNPYYLLCIYKLKLKNHGEARQGFPSYWKYGSGHPCVSTQIHGFLFSKI